MATRRFSRKFRRSRVRRSRQNKKKETRRNMKGGTGARVERLVSDGSDHTIEDSPRKRKRHCSIYDAIERYFNPKNTSIKTTAHKLNKNEKINIDI